MYLLQSIFAKNVCLLIQFIMAQGYFVTLGEAWRPQITAHYYSSHHMGIKNSLHCNRMAIDLNIYDHKGNYLKDGDIYRKAGQYWESLDNRNRWGGNFIGTVYKDTDHWEMHDVPIHRLVKVR